MISMKKINQKGQILVIVFIALGLVLFTVLSIVSGAQLYFSNTSYSVNSEMATALAEAGIDKAITSINETGGTYTGEGVSRRDFRCAGQRKKSGATAHYLDKKL